jgi:hypothetical protein
VSSGFLLLAAGTLIFFWLFFMLADYSWESKKLRGLDSRVRPEGSSERAEYRWYSWVRYLTVVALTYLNTFVLVVSQIPGRENPSDVLAAILLVIVLVLLLHVVDNFWDRKRPRGLSRVHRGLFWSYFWARYPALILATIAAATRGL